VSAKRKKLDDYSVQDFVFEPLLHIEDDNLSSDAQNRGLHAEEQAIASREAQQFVMVVVVS